MSQHDQGKKVELGKPARRMLTFSGSGEVLTMRQWHKLPEVLPVGSSVQISLGDFFDLF